MANLTEMKKYNSIHKLRCGGYELLKAYKIYVDFKGFWQGCIILRITELLDFVHCPVF
jgi:hypothetical protein